MADNKTASTSALKASAPDPAPDQTEAKPATAGNLDLGYLVLTEESPKPSRVKAAIAAAQSWTLPVPHPQDHRYTLAARRELLMHLDALLNPAQSVQYPHG